VLAAGSTRLNDQEGFVKLFTKGNRVSQANYGAGTVVSSDERYTVIEFDNHGRRVFITDMVTLGKTDEPAPNKPVKGRRKKAVAVPEPEAAEE
jgi:hypothetical protein